MSTFEFEGLRPVIYPGAFVHPSAVLIGDVIVGIGSYVGPCASLRGDFGRIEIGAGANVQDNCTVHSFPGKLVVIEDHAHVGHGAVLHGCHVGQNALVGMNSVVMDRSRIGADSIIGASSFVKSGTEIEAGTLWLGSPAKFVRMVTEEERSWKAYGTRTYQNLSMRCLAGLSECSPLSEEEPGRGRSARDHVTLPEWRNAEL